MLLIPLFLRRYCVDEVTMTRLADTADAQCPLFRHCRRFVGPITQKGCCVAQDLGCIFGTLEFLSEKAIKRDLDALFAQCGWLVRVHGYIQGRLLIASFPP